MNGCFRLSSIDATDETFPQRHKQKQLVFFKCNKDLLFVISLGPNKIQQQRQQNRWQLTLGFAKHF